VLADEVGLALDRERKEEAIKLPLADADRGHRVGAVGRPP